MRKTKKVLLWVGVGFLGFIAVVMVYAVLGMNDTLNLKIGRVDLSEISDGVYTGTYDCFRWSNTVNVSVKNHTITDIEVVKAPNGRNSVGEELTQQILTEQNLPVDAVSGATADKKAFLRAVEIALRNGVAEQ